jgi:phage tail-like protein
MLGNAAMKKRQVKKGQVMAVLRNDPYPGQNFLVDLGDGVVQGPDGAFAEVSGLQSWIEVAEYREGNQKSASPRKIPGLVKTADVTLKRGIIGSLRLFSWFDAVRKGDMALRNVTITLLDEQRQPVLVWKLIRARPVKYTGPTLNAEGADIAMEELVLSYERLEME